MYKQNYLNVFINDDGDVVIVSGCPYDKELQSLELNTTVISADLIDGLISALSIAKDAIKNMECI